MCIGVFYLNQQKRYCQHNCVGDKTIGAIRVAKLHLCQDATCLQNFLGRTLSGLGKCLAKVIKIVTDQMGNFYYWYTSSDLPKNYFS
jgi:hypothetical protein